MEISEKYKEEIDLAYDKFLKWDVEFLKDKSISEIKNRMESIWCKCFSMGIPRFYNPIETTFDIFRIIPTEYIKTPNIVSGYSYPTKEKTGKPLSIGRANLPNQSVFYASNEHDTALNEFITHSPKFSGEVSLSRWEIKSNCILWSPLIDTTKLRKMEIPFPIAKYDPYVSYLAIKIGDIFKEDSTYIKSAYIADSILFGKEKIELLAFPSVRNGKVNVVIKPNAVNDNSKVEFKDVLNFKIIESSSDIKKIEIDDFANHGILEDGKIKWTNNIDLSKETSTTLDIRNRFFTKYE